MFLTTYARILGAVLTIALPLYCGWDVLFHATDIGRLGVWFNTYGICCGVLLGLVELPSICTCMECCKVLVRYTKVLSGFWLTRAAVHLSVGAGWFAIFTYTTHNPLCPDCAVAPGYVVALGIAMLGTSLLYLLGALWKREPNPGGDAKEGGGAPAKEAAANSAGSSGGGFAGFFSRFAVRTVAANPAAAAAAAGAAAPHLAGALFGGDASPKGGGSGRTSPQGFYGEEPAAASSSAADKASMFTGGGLFGGGSSKATKYGVEAEEEGNPFMS